MTDALFVAGVGIACFVAYNIGGSTTGPSFGPAVGANAVSKVTAAALMSVCFFGGAWTLGRRVVETLGEGLLRDPSVFTLPVSITVLLFVGLALLAGNVSGAPASTSMTAVGAIVGLGLSAGTVNWAVLGEIAIWWLVSPAIGFWVSVMIGRYFYPRIERAVAIDQSEGPLLTVDRDGGLPRPTLGPNTTRRELFGTVVLVGIGCLMAFSSGTSNVANAIAPLVGSGELGMNTGILAGSAAVAVGAFTIARRTMETLGNDITDLPLTAATVVAVVSSGIIIALSAAGVPASFVVVATMCIVGLGWGQATRTFTIAEAVRGRADPRVSVGALRSDEAAPTVGDPEIDDGDGATSDIGEDSSADLPDTADLFDPSTTVRVVAMQNLVPVAATVGSFLAFELVFFG